MPRFLDTRGNSELGIGVCDRCKMKFPIVDLHEDRNTPGLLVCDKDNDEFDPWRLPPREEDDVTLEHYRPDEDIGISPASDPWPTFRTLEDPEDIYRVDEDDSDYRITQVYP